MILKALTNGKVTGSGILKLDAGMLGAISISTDGTNAAAVSVTDSTGQEIFDISTKSPGFILGPFHAASKELNYSVTGTGAAAQFYEYIT